MATAGVQNPTGQSEVQRGESRHQQRERRRAVTQSQWAAEQNQVETDVAAEQREHLLRQYGDFTLAYSTAVQPRLTHFGDSEGYLAHRSRWGTAFALGDPVCSADQRRSLLHRFVDQHHRPAFCQISAGVAAELAQQGYFINPFGVDTTLWLDDYTLAGKSREWLRYAWNWTQRRDYQIKEASFEEVLPSEVEKISEAWRGTRTIKHKEVRFLNRPIVLQDEPDVRKFFLIGPNGKTLAFVFLDPLYRDGEVIGYCTSFKRRHPEAPQYAEQAIMKYVIETLKAEGVPQLKLGLSPLFDGGEAANQDVSGQPKWPTSTLTKRLFRATYNSRIVNRRFYHLQGHATYKSRFRGAEETMYLAMPKSFSPRKLATLIALCGIV